MVLQKYLNDFTGRVGLKISESLITPEADDSLTDNSTGSSNFAAKGAHRIKISCALATVTESSVADEEFIELLRIKNGIPLTRNSVEEINKLIKLNEIDDKLLI